MRVVFVCRGAENLGVEVLSAVLKRAGHDVSLVFDPGLFGDKHFLENPFLERIFSVESTLPDQIERRRPDLVGFSVVTNLYPWARRVSLAVRRRLGVPVVWGGVHPSALPDRVLDSGACDFVIRGEGEAALLELVDQLSGPRRFSTIRNLSWRDGDRNVHNPMRPGYTDLGALPLPDKALFAPHFDFATSYLTLTSRGCPYRCSYCCAALSSSGTPGAGTRLRYHTVEQVLAELHVAVDTYRPRHVLFTDDIFVANLPRLRELLARYRREIGLPFHCITHPRTLTRATARLLVEAGCERCQIGIQSMDEAVRRRTLNRFETDAEIYRAVEAAEAEGLRYFCDHMFNLPDDQETDLRNALRFYAGRTGLLRVATSHLSYFPLAPITALAAERGLLTPEDLERIAEGEFAPMKARSTLGAGDDARQARFASADMAFKLLPLLPARFRPLVAREEVFARLGSIPAPIGLLLDSIQAIRTKDRHAERYVRTYLRGLRRWLQRG